MNKQYVNPDNGENATICEKNGKYIIYTDLNANEKSFDNLSDAKHELFVRGYEPVKN